jgi:hypothetical protein
VSALVASAISWRPHQVCPVHRSSRLRLTFASQMEIVRLSLHRHKLQGKMSSKCSKSSVTSSLLEQPRVPFCDADFDAKLTSTAAASLMPNWHQNPQENTHTNIQINPRARAHTHTHTHTQTSIVVLLLSLACRAFTGITIRKRTHTHAHVHTLSR